MELGGKLEKLSGAVEDLGRQRRIVRCLCLWNGSYGTCLEQVEKRESSAWRKSPDLVMESQSYPGGNSALRESSNLTCIVGRVRV